jgi:phosphoribosylaminoimidazole-succinocarboxamide synthase
MALPALLQSQLKSVPLAFRGKVRDVYNLNDELLIVATDRISAFDYILSTPIPEKGILLTQISRFWMKKFANIIPNHLVNIPLEKVILDPKERKQVEGRAEVVRKAKPLPVEMIVRGYLAGSGWVDYQKTGTVCGIKLPKGLEQAQRLPEPIFTPSTKAPQGQHDENISFEQMAEKIGKKLAEQCRDKAIQLYNLAAEHAQSRGIIFADTKLEFGLIGDQLILIDEVFTPDSSRFWPASEYKVGISPPSYDKQFVRDWLLSTSWDKNSPPPPLPPEVVQKTAEKYREALRVLTE